ncbi:hypothetical protein [Vibrio sp. E150_018]
MEENKIKHKKSDLVADLIYGFLLLSGGLIVAASVYTAISILNGGNDIPPSLYSYNVVVGFLMIVIPTFTLGWIIIAIGKITSLLGIIARK